MRDKDVVFSAARGSRYVIHLAADYRLWSPHGQDIMRANVEGTRVVMEAAKAAGAERIIYTSSVATLKLRQDGVPADETTPLAETDAYGAYKRSKIAAERLVEQMIGRGLPAIIVNPSTPVGPRDLRPTPTGRMIIEAASGRMPAYVDTGLNRACGQCRVGARRGASARTHWSALYSRRGEYDAFRIAQHNRAVYGTSAYASACHAAQSTQLRSPPKLWHGSQRASLSLR